MSTEIPAEAEKLQADYELVRAARRALTVAAYEKQKASQVTPSDSPPSSDDR